MKSAVVLALLLAALSHGAWAKEKKAGQRGRGAGGTAAASCDPADLDGCAKLAERRLAADPGDVSFEGDRKEARQQLRGACAGGVLHACSSLADSEERFPSGDELFRAATLRTRTCEGGDVRDCEKLGVQLIEGRGLATDPVRAAEALRRACEGGSVSSCRRLAVLLASGASADPAATQRWRERGCDLGDADACAEASEAFGRGLLARDAKKGRALDEKACALGRGASCFVLARAEPATGAEKKPDLVAAAGWLRKGCDGSDGNSCWELAQLTMHGKAGARDDERALDLMLLACAQGKGGEACRDATEQSLRAALPPPPAGPPPPPRQRSWVPVLGTSAAALGLAITGVYQATQSRQLASDLGLDPQHDTQGRRDAIDAYNKRSRLLYGGAALLLVTSATFFFVF